MSQTMFAIAGLGPPSLYRYRARDLFAFRRYQAAAIGKALGQSKKAFREGIEEGEREAAHHKEVRSSG